MKYFKIRTVKWLSKMKRNFIKQQFLLLLLSSFIFQQVIAQNNTTAQLKRVTISASGSSKNVRLNNKIYTLQQSIGQASVIGTFKNEGYKARQGFIQPDVFSKIKNESIPLNLNLVVYPNPFTEGVTLSFKEPIEAKIEVTLYDMLGRLLFMNKYDKQQNIDLKLHHIASANYIIKVVANNKQFIKNIIKK
jgi:hypothetical protein